MLLTGAISPDPMVQNADDEDDRKLTVKAHAFKSQPLGGRSRLLSGVCVGGVKEPEKRIILTTDLRGLLLPEQ